MSSTSLSASLAQYYAKPLLIRMVGQKEYDWMQSPQYTQLVAAAQAQSPGKRIHDKRTKAHKYWVANESRYHKLYKEALEALSNKSIDDQPEAIQ